MILFVQHNVFILWFQLVRLLFFQVLISVKVVSCELFMNGIIMSFIFLQLILLYFYVKQFQFIHDLQMVLVVNIILQRQLFLFIIQNFITKISNLENLSVNAKHRSCTMQSKTFLIPHSSFPIPHSSLLIPHSTFPIPHSSLLTPHSSLLIPHSSFLIPSYLQHRINIL